MRAPAASRAPAAGLCLGSLLLALPWLLWVYWPAGNGLDVTGNPIGRDFINVWAAPQLAFSGRVAQLFDLPAYHAAIGNLFGKPLPFHNWSYPPFVLPAFWPFAQLSYAVALAAWTLSTFALLAAITLSQVPRHQRPLAGVLLLLAPASLINIASGQNGFLTAALLIGGTLALQHRPMLAGVLFGMLTFKPHLGIVVPFALVALRAWSAVAVAVVTMVVLVLVSVTLFGLEPWGDYLSVTGAYQVHLLERFSGFYPLMMTSVAAAGRMIGLSLSAALVLQAAVALPAIVTAMWTVTRTTDARMRALVMASATPLVSPYVFNYDLTAPSAAILWILCGRLAWSGGAPLVLTSAWVLPLAAMYLHLAGIAAAPLVLLGLFAVAVFAAVSPRRPAVEAVGASAGVPA